MLVLGIESSCDETAVALYHSEQGLLVHEVYIERGPVGAGVNFGPNSLFFAIAVKVDPKPLLKAAKQFEEKLKGILEQSKVAAEVQEKKALKL